nr:endonuclease/exonuclease/phosphatase family protein [Oceanobacillus saliphilus]
MVKIKVMTYNIHHGVGTDQRLDLNRIAEVIRKSNSDIIALNEVDKYFSKRSDYMDQIGWLANHLNMDYAFAPALSLKSKGTLPRRQYGIALLSRFSILTKKVHAFEFIPGLFEGRSILDTTIQIHEKIVNVHVTHLSLNPFLHRIQTSFIVDLLKDNPYPVIVMGDCNMKPRSKGWRKITRVFQDAWLLEGKGSGYTYSTLRPRFRLDYIFVDRNFDVIQAEMETTNPKASDHFPVKAQLHLK